VGAGFQDRWIKPLSHPSGILLTMIRTSSLRLTVKCFSTVHRHFRDTTGCAFVVEPVGKKSKAPKIYPPRSFSELSLPLKRADRQAVKGFD
jgi:hypothetical protein